MKKLTIPVLMYKQSGSHKKGTLKEHHVVPTWNHLYQIRNSRKFLDQWALKHKEKIEILTLNWAEEQKWKMTENQKVFVDMWVYWPDARPRDCHNIDKIILDAIEGIIFDNDSNALVRYQDFDIDIVNPRVEIQFTIGEDFDRKKRVKQLKSMKKETD